MSTAWVQFSTIARKELTRVLRIWGQTLLPSVITNTLYLVIFGTFIGTQIAEVQGVAYVQFLVPGIIMMSVIINSYTNVVSSFFSTKFQRNVEEIMVSPTPDWVIVLGYASGGVLRSMLIASLLLGISLFFAPLQIAHAWLMALLVILTSAMFSLAGFLNALYAKKFDDLFIVPTFILTPLTYLGGVFYSISLLPPVWQQISLANPILHIINGFRYSMLGVSDAHIGIGIAMLSLITAALFAANLFLLRKGIGLRN